MVYITFSTSHHLFLLGSFCHHGIGAASSDRSIQGVTFLSFEVDGQTNSTYSDRCLALKSGCIVMDAKGNDLLNNDQVKKIFDAFRPFL